MTDELSKPIPERRTLKSLLGTDSVKAQIARALPRHVTPDRFLRVATTSLLRNPKLAECDEASFMGALLTLSQYGLEPDGRLAHLIPFRNNKTNTTECQVIIDYKGLVELCRRSGCISTIMADVICEKDHFEFEKGSNSRLVHLPAWTDRGSVLGAYAIAKLQDGGEQFDVMNKGEIDAIRGRSRSGQTGPWTTDYNEMAKKTVLRRLTKLLPLSSEYRDAVNSDSDSPEFSEPKPAKGRVVEAPLFVVSEPVGQAEGERSVKP